MNGEAEGRLHRLLDDLGAAVIAGDLRQLAQIEAALRDCEGTITGDAQTLRLLREKAERNHRLLIAAGRGVRAAQGRLGDIARAVAGLGFYDAQGQLQRRPPSGQQIAKRL